MKKQFVKTLREGDVVNDYYVATRKDLRPTQSGGKFLGMVFKDKTGEIGGVMWNNAISVAEMFELGDVVNVRGTVNTYQSRLQVRVDQVLPLKEDEYDAADLVEVSQDATKHTARFREIVESIEHPHLRALTRSFLNDEAFMEAFAGAGAGKRWHHAYRGGLLEHCWEMAEIALLMCKLYPDIDRDLLLTGVLLHDIGKLEEMSHDLFIDYTTEGKLVGHLQIGCNMVAQRMEQIDGFPDTLKTQVQHLILSHHGEMQFGSPVVPKTLEAMVLYHIDNLDAQTNAISRVVAETRQNRAEWSDYQPLIERNIWAGRPS